MSYTQPRHPRISRFWCQRQTDTAWRWASFRAAQIPSALYSAGMCELLGMECNVQTDSEHAFCALLSALAKDFPAGPPSRDALATAVAGHAGRIGKLGTFNMLLGDGDQLFARCSTKLHHLIRKAPFQRATLADDDVSVDFAELTRPRDRVAVVATAPLTRDENWIAGVPDTLWVFRRGRLTHTLAS